MTTSVTIHMTPDELDQMLRRIVREEMNLNEVLINASQAKKLLGINNHQTFNRMMERYGVPSISTGKTARYRMNDIMALTRRGKQS